MTREEAHTIMENLQRIFTQYRFMFSDKLAEANGMAILALEKQPKQKNGKKFIEIVVTHLVNCPYPEYKGKPYFSIRYEENGEKIEGFGTYKPEVLSKYIREYFMDEKKGEWIDLGSGDFECSVCHERSCCGGNYCPDCGADMRGEKQDG